jgi:glucose-specific phosphotransferase system IIA component
MGFMDKLFGKKTEAPAPAAPAPSAAKVDTMVCAPFKGTAMPLDKIDDPVFSQGVLGPGCGMEPADETVCAPFDGTISQVTDTKHAIGITSTGGAEVLIHVGMDTVEMEGDGFECLVKMGQSVKKGDALMTFSIEKIKAAGHPATTAIVVTNADEFAAVELVAEGAVEQGADILTVKA